MKTKPCLIVLTLILLFNSCKKVQQDLVVYTVPDFIVPPSGSGEATFTIKDIDYEEPIDAFHLTAKVSHLPAGMTYTIETVKFDGDEAEFVIKLNATDVKPGAYKAKFFAYGDKDLFAEQVFKIDVVDFSLSNFNVFHNAVDVVEGSIFNYGFNITKDLSSADPQACIFSRIMSITTINDQFYDVEGTINKTTGDIRIETNLPSPYELDSAIGKMSYNHGVYGGVIHYSYFDQIWQSHYEGTITF